jgi:hypothetical protein
VLNIGEAKKRLYATHKKWKNIYMIFPIKFDGKEKDLMPEYLSLNIGESIFMVSDSALICQVCIGRYSKDNSPATNYLWGVYKPIVLYPEVEVGMKNTYIIEGMRVKKEKFITHLTSNFPEHLSWILFNPEWLK